MIRLSFLSYIRVFIRVFICLLMGSVIFFSYNSQIYAEKIENLTIDRYVNDYAQVIDDPIELTLNNQLAQFATVHGHQILVITVNDLDGDYIEHYSIKLAEKVKAGNAKYDNGLILLLSKNDRAIRIEVGYGLEPTITDGISNHIIQSMIPLLRQQQYTDAINQATQSLMQTALGYKIDSVISNGSSIGSIYRDPVFWFVMFYFLYVVLVWLASVLGRTKSWWLGGVIGAIIGTVVIIFGGLWMTNIILTCVITALGLLFDYIVSQDYRQYLISQGKKEPHRWTGGTRGPGSMGGGSDRSGGFGGFSGSGGGFGGGGASGKW